LIPELPPPPAGVPAHGPRDLPAVRWGPWQAIAVFFVGNLVIAQVVVGSIVLVVMGVGSGEPIEGLPQIVATVAADVAFLAAMLVWLTWRARDWRSRVGLRFGAKGLRDAAVGFGAGALLYFVVGVVVAVPLLSLFRRLFGADVAAPEQIPGGLSINAKILTAFLALVLAPVTEELFYRGIFYRSLRDRHGVVVGALVSAILFGASHVVNAPWRDVVFLQTLMVFTGIGLALIYERRANLVADIAAHVAFNVIGIVIIFSTR
jgi:membrane protease YdiL (CAAX protease family)